MRIFEVFNVSGAFSHLKINVRVVIYSEADPSLTKLFLLKIRFNASPKTQKLILICLALSVNGEIRTMRLTMKSAKR